MTYLSRKTAALLGRFGRGPRGAGPRFEQTQWGWCKAHVCKGVEFLRRNGQVGRHLYEFGCYRGATLRAAVELFYAYGLPLDRAFGFDSFRGLPKETAGVELFPLFQEGVFGDVSELATCRNTVYVNGWFSDLTAAHVTEHAMGSAALVHVDADLHLSTVQCLTFMFSNNLLGPGAVVAYDEFKSTSTLRAGGESLAHLEITERFGVRWREFFRNVYFDRTEIWQNAFVIEQVGAKSPRHGIVGFAG
jgi:hypothetical protein